ncbi:MAG: phosphoenolpyruvate synthase [Bacteroidales bacterium]|nr:phosphoenolpyruvate synthase [Candidatus Equibacterium intestinale]
MEEYRHFSFENETVHDFMKFRISRILQVCSNYDGYTLEEDGHIESQIRNEYNELNMSNPPSILRVTSAEKALELLESGEKFDFVLTMYNVGQMSVFDFARGVKKLDQNMPVVLLTSYSREIHRRIEESDCDAIDNVFCWHGNADLIIAIIKLMEDRLNAHRDILEGGVQAILLVEDSFRFYSSYLPELYRIILAQNSKFIEDAYNEQQMVMRKRSRPKVLLATNYSEAVEMYQTYRQNLLGVITDLGMIVNKGDLSENEKPDAGVDICRMVKEQTPWMPVIMQSSQVSYSALAESLGVGFIAKTSKTLLEELQNIILSEFGFGDFVFKDPQTGKVVGQAADLYQMQKLIEKVPEDTLEYHLSQMHFSKWLYARGLFPIAKILRSFDNSQFESMAEHRAAIVSLLHDYRRLLGQGIVVQFDEKTYNSSIAFAKIGEGSIGGKARGLAFMNGVLSKYHQYNRYKDVRVRIPRSVVVATDYFEQFMKMNGLQHIITQEISDETLLSEFLNSIMPPDLYVKLKKFVSTCKAPLAIRSSSKLEDSNFQPFAGVYSTYMIPRCEDDDQMLRMLIRGIKSVYASVFFTSSKAYIQSSQNVLSEEKMAVLIQEVCGTEQDGYWYPTISGVARSQNAYPLGYEKAEDGVCNIVMGLGKAVVDGGKTLRFCPAYPDKVLQTSTVELTMSDAQTGVMALNLDPGRFTTSTDDAVNIETLPIEKVENSRNAKFVCSNFDFTNNRIVEGPTFGQSYKVITFNKILKYNSFPLAEIISSLLKIGEEELRCPVEIEFAVNMDVAPGKPRVFNFLQIRPIISGMEASKVDWSSIDTAGSLIYSECALGIGQIKGLRHLVYMKFDKFNSLRTREIADELFKINTQMHDAGHEYVLVGTGRWGSSDPNLGVPVKWAHISEAKVIVEMALENFNIEASQGTHFFQNVTSLGVGYLSIDPFRGHGVFDQEALDAMPAAIDGEWFRVVEFPEDLTIYIDSKTKRAVVKR